MASHEVQYKVRMWRVPGQTRASGNKSQPARLPSLVSQYDVLVCLTEMLRNFALLEWPRHHSQTESLFSASLTKPPEEEEAEFTPLDSLRMVVNYVNNLILLALEVQK